MPTKDQEADYADYLAFIKQYPDLGLPVPQNINDFIEHQAEWEKEFAPSPEPPEPEEPPTPLEPKKPEYTYEQGREFIDYRKYAYKYGDPYDWEADTIDDYFKNLNVVRRQLRDWKAKEAREGEEGEKASKYTDDQYREYNTYKNYASAYGDPADWYPVNIGDYFGNYDVAQEQLKEWRQEETEKGAERGRQKEEYEAEKSERARQRKEYEAKQAEYERWALSPEEQARRREEGYQSALESRARAEYAAREAYGEAPEYRTSFSNWLQTQGSQSQYLKDYIENKYPSLRTQYEATQPRLTGYPTREEARAEAERREVGFKAWLPTQLPSVEEEFWGQRPTERGERPAAYAPRMRHIAW